jgi:hypothetical protein
MGGHRTCRTVASWARCWTGFVLLTSVALTGNCNAKNVAGPISGSLRPMTPTWPCPRCSKKCCWTYFALGRQRCCKKYCWTHSAHFALGGAPGSLRKMLLDLFHSRSRQRCCKKYCWTHSAHFALGGAPGSLRKMLLDLFHSRPRQRCCKKYCWTHSVHFALGGAPVPAARNVAEPISPSIAGSAAVKNAVGRIPRQPGSASARVHF